MLKDKLQGIVIGTTITVLLMSTIPVLAKSAQEAILVSYNNIKLYVDGKQVQTENEPFIYNGRTYLPVRDVANAIGKEATWDGNTQTVYLGSVPANVSIATPSQPTSTTSTSNQAVDDDYLNYSSFDAYIKAKGIDVHEANRDKAGSSIEAYYYNTFLKKGMTLIPINDNQKIPSGMTVVESYYEPAPDIKGIGWSASDIRYLVVEYNGKTYMSSSAYGKRNGYWSASAYLTKKANITRATEFDAPDKYEYYGDYTVEHFEMFKTTGDTYYWYNVPQDIALFVDNGDYPPVVFINVEVADKITSKPHDKIFHMD